VITIVDYGAGNLRSVENTLSELGAEYRLVGDISTLAAAEKIILPGVGHYGQIMRSLHSSGLKSTLLDALDRGVPFLGICIGLQSLFEGSEEDREVEGLGVYPGTVLKFRGEMRVPHMGWNQVEPRKPCKLLSGIGEESYFYFAHSYYVAESEITGAVCEYGAPYTAILEDGNRFGVQFHPEKSGPLGLKVVRNFIEL
jgi:imidazole glycerol phosphate synthase glutamine amidotransferase subunit